MLLIGLIEIRNSFLINHGNINICYDLNSKITSMKNFYPNQYLQDSSYQINHNYLSEQFSESEYILQKINEVVKNNDFTLGKTVDEVEELIAAEADTKYAIGVGSGTDALMLSLKSLGIGAGDAVAQLATASCISPMEYRRWMRLLVGRRSAAPPLDLGGEPFGHAP